MNLPRTRSSANLGWRDPLREVDDSKPTTTMATTKRTAIESGNFSDRIVSVVIASNSNRGSPPCSSRCISMRSLAFAGQRDGKRSVGMLRQRSKPGTCAGRPTSSHWLQILLGGQPDHSCGALEANGFDPFCQPVSDWWDSFRIQSWCTSRE